MIILTYHSSVNSPAYVAAVWNTYRTNRLMILNTIVRCSKRLEKVASYYDENFQVEGLVSEMIASIPFHVADNLANLVERARNNLELTIIPGRSIGGILLMYQLFDTSNISIICAQSRCQMRDCLAWIGSHMGIGEATILSSVRESKFYDALQEG